MIESHKLSCYGLKTSIQRHFVGSKFRSFFALVWSFSIEALWSLHIFLRVDVWNLIFKLRSHIKGMTGALSERVFKMHENNESIQTKL